MGGTEYGVYVMGLFAPSSVFRSPHLIGATGSDRLISEIRSLALQDYAYPPLGGVDCGLFWCPPFLGYEDAGNGVVRIL